MKGLTIMPRRGENIRKRKDGRWEGRYICDRKPDGKAIYRSVYGHSYFEVKRRLNDITATARKPKAHITVTKTFGDAARSWLSSCALRLKPSTIARYTSMLDNHILPVFRNTSLYLISEENVADFIKIKSTELAGSTVRSLLVMIKTIMKYSRKQGWCDNVIIDLRLQSEPKRDVSALPPDERMRLENFLLIEPDLIKLGLYLCLYTGLRVGELCALKWENIDLSKRIMYVTSTIQRISQTEKQLKEKTKLIITDPKSASSKRDIPLPKPLVLILRSYRGEDHSFFLSGTDKPIEPRKVQYRFKKYAQQLNLSYSNPHSLRHTFATRCIELGFDVKTLSELLGHSKVEITLNRYVHSSDERKRSQMALLYANSGQNNGVYQTISNK